MKRGFTFIELVVVIALIAVLVSTASVSVVAIKERRDVEKAVTEAEEIMSSYLNKSYHEGEAYKLQIDGGSKRISVYKIEIKEGEPDKEIFEESFQLPENLIYEVIKDDVSMTSPEGVYTGERVKDEVIELKIKAADETLKYNLEFHGNKDLELVKIRMEKY